MHPADDHHPIRPDAVSPAHGGTDEESAVPSMEGLHAGGGLDMGALLEQATKMQEGLMAAQQQVTDSVVEGASGGGVVKVVVNGAMDFRSVTIDPAAVDPGDVEMLQDLILAALHDAVSRVEQLQQEAMSAGGMDLGGLLGGDA